MTSLEYWENGEPLQSAYFEFAAFQQKEELRNSKTPGQSKMLKILMLADLFARLANGSIAAFGYRTAPHLSDGPILIPAHSFQRRPTLDECESDLIVASGWRYERVRICDFRAENEIKASENNEPKPGNKIGRRSTYAAARETLNEIRENDETQISQSAFDLLKEFNRRYANHAKAHGFIAGSLSERTLRNHLTRFQQELAEIGSNKDAI